MKKLTQQEQREISTAAQALLHDSDAEKLVADAVEHAEWLRAEKEKLRAADPSLN